VLAAQHAPFAALALVGGAWADRAERRRLMLATDLVRAATQALAAALLIADAAELWHLAALAAVYGVADAFFAPALIGLVPAAAGPERAVQANGLLRTSAHVSQLAGAPLGGVLVATLGAGEAIAIDAATFVISAGFLARMPRLVAVREAEPEPTLRAIATGWRAVRERAWLVRFLVVLLGYHLVMLPCVWVLGPLIAERELDGATSWGVINGAFAVGAIVGSVLAVRARTHPSMRFVGFAFALASLQAAVIALGGTTAGIAAFLALAGVAVALAWIMWESTVQRRMPEHLVSRAISFDLLVSTGSLPLGMALIGPLGEAVGVQATMIGASALVCALAGVYALTTR
jgi:MFS family permease